MANRNLSVVTNTIASFTKRKNAPPKERVELHPHVTEWRGSHRHTGTGYPVPAWTLPECFRAENHAVHRLSRSTGKWRQRNLWKMAVLQRFSSAKCSTAHTAGY